MTKYCQNFRDCTAPIAKNGFKFNKIIFYCLAGALVVSLTVVYLFEVNSIAAKGFFVRDLQKQISQIKSDNEKLQLRLIDLKASPDISKRIENLKMIPVDKISYYDASGELVVRK